MILPPSSRQSPRRLNDRAAAERLARALQQRVRSEFSATTMVENGLAAYREAIGLRQLARLA